MSPETTGDATEPVAADRPTALTTTGVLWRLFARTGGQWPAITALVFFGAGVFLAHFRHHFDEPHDVLDALAVSPGKLVDDGGDRWNFNHAVVRLMVLIETTLRAGGAHGHA